MNINNETKIGIFVVCVVIFLVGLTVKAGKFASRKEGYRVKAVFHNVDGIDKNAPVMLNGLEVGRVEDIHINYEGDETLMELTLWIESTAKLREGAKATVKLLGFMGEKYVGLTTGDKGKTFLPAGSIIMGEEPADFQKLVADGQNIAANIKDISENLKARLEKNEEHIDSIFMNLDTTMTHMASITGNLDERLTVNEKHIDGIFANLHSTTVNLDQMSYDLKENPWKLLYRPKNERMKNAGK